LWDWDLETGVVYRSDTYLKLCGYPRAEDTKDFAFFERMVHPEDLGDAARVIENYRQNLCEQIEFEFRLMTKTGFHGTWMMARGRAIGRSSAGFPTRIVGTITDITHSKRVDADLRDREKRLTRVIDGSNQGYWDWNIQTNSLTVSARWASMLGYRLDEVDVSEGRFSEYVHPEDFVAVMGLAQQHTKGDLAYLEAEIRCLTKSGAWKWILTRGRIVERDALGAPLMMAGTHTDISERKSFELAQKDATTVFENSYEGIMVVGADGLITRVNPAFTRICGYSKDEVVGKSPKILSSGRQDARFYRDMYESLKKFHYWSGEIWNRRKNGEIYAELLSISAVVGSADEVLHYIGIFSDISQLKAHEAELDRIAHYDPLTGAPNRRLLADRMQQSIVRADRHQQSVAICYLDLDGFKEVNDRFGHAVGDRLLIDVANSLRHVLRTDDTLSRLGGDEFVILLDNVSSPEECSLILERLLSAICVHRQIDEHDIVISASIGVSLYPLDHSDADTLLRHADNAMYQAKEHGKNRYILFDPDSDHKAQVHRNFVDRMHQALRNDEFRLHYQPKVDLVTREVVGVEALIRWQHPENGLLSPAAFLPHVEGSSVDHPLGRWVIESALSQAAQWLEMGTQMKVSVNVGANHLMRPEFLSELKAALARYPSLKANQLELEVLESVAISDMEKTVAVLNECRSLGVKLALDDFGTGYSSLTYLRKLPVDILKIDQSFVMNMLQDSEDRDIVEGVIRLAGAFDRIVIAEGVETLEHGEALVQMGCRLAQGYGIAKPMPPDEVLRWISTWSATQA
jgi:diguanylate cyclase (GGDEF)-like protein/PAS domain S-box-containing protein